MNNAILVKADDWEGLFVNGKLVEEGHELNEGISRVKYFNKLAKTYGFKLSEMEEAWVTDEYDEELSDTGSFHELLKDVRYILDKPTKDED